MTSKKSFQTPEEFDRITKNLTQFADVLRHLVPDELLYPDTREIEFDYEYDFKKQSLAFHRSLKVKERSDIKRLESFMRDFSSQYPAESSIAINTQTGEIKISVKETVLDKLVEA